MCDDPQCKLRTENFGRSARCFVPPPEWFAQEVDLLAQVAQAVCRGQTTKASELLGRIRSEDLHRWFNDHQSGLFRILNALGKPPKLTGTRRSAALARKVFERDCYWCQWCGVRVVDRQVLRALGAAFPKFVAGRGKKVNGTAKVFAAVADHVVPIARGGQDDLENLVTACSICNYGRMDWTIEEAGLVKPPRGWHGSDPSWDCLMSLLPKLEALVAKGAVSPAPA